MRGPSVLEWLRERDEWKFFGVLPKADHPLAITWWTLLVLRGLLPASFAVAMGLLVAAVQRGGALALPLSIVGIVFVALQVSVTAATRQSAKISAAAPPRGSMTN